MKKKSDASRWLHKTRKVWTILLHFAAFVMSIIGGFLLPIEGSGEAERFAPFVIAAITGLVFSLLQRRDARKTARKWNVIAASAILLSILAFLGYGYLKRGRTCSCYGQEFTIGTRYTNQAQSYISQNHNLSCEQLLADFTCKVTDVWTAESINLSRLILEAVYLAAVCLSTVCLLAIGHAIYSTVK